MKCTIRTLVESLPSSIEHIDSKGMTPIHMLFRATDSDDIDGARYISSNVVSLLTSSKAAKTMNPSNFQYPLHYACRKNATIEILQLLVAANSHALIEMDKKGRTPLHLYLLSSFSFDSCYIFNSQFFASLHNNNRM